jgi:RNA polymerase-associated protein RTF1
VRVPSINQIEQKAADLKLAKEYVLNDKEVNEMIEKKKAVKGASVNAAMEKAQLLARLEHAKGHNETEKVIKLRKELRELEERIAIAEGSNKNVWADINNRNRSKDRIEVHEAELRIKEARRKVLLESAKANNAAQKADEANGT